MPILDLQRRMHETGRIRIGYSVPTGKTDRNGNPVSRAVKLEKFRLTARSRDAISQAAQVYGGDVRQWEDHWEVYTEATSIPVVVPPTDQALTQFYELWSGGGAQRRCDGQRELISDRPCMCDPDPAERDCKPTTRLSLLLPDVAGVGLWRLESHGYYAAVELAGVVDLIQAAAGRGVMLPARLRLEQRKIVRNGRTNRFAVPVLDVDAPLAQIAAAAGVRLAIGDTTGGEPVEIGEPATSPQLPSGLTPVPDDAPTRPAASVADQVGEVHAKVEAGPTRRGATPIARTGLAPRTVEQARESADTPRPTPAAPPDHGHDEDQDDDEGRDTSEWTLTRPQQRKVFAACADNGIDDDVRHGLIGEITGGRTQSLNDVRRGELEQLLAAIEAEGRDDPGSEAVDWKGVAAEIGISPAMLLVRVRGLAAEHGLEQPGHLDEIVRGSQLEALALGVE